MGFDIMKPVLNLEPKYRITMLTREEWTRSLGTPPAIKGLVWFTDGVQGYGQSVNRRLSISLGECATGFQTDVYAMLAYVNETETQDRPEEYVSIRSDSHAALKALQAVKITSPLVWQCQQALNGISTWHAVGPYWVLGHARVRGNEIANSLARDGCVQRFVGPELFLGAFR
jgi:ribonuclease HI